MTFVNDPLDPKQPLIEFFKGGTTGDGRVRNKNFNPALYWWVHHGQYDHRPLHVRLHDLVKRQSQAGLPGKLHAHGTIHTSLTSSGDTPRGQKLLLFPGYAKPAIHPYSGQGSDAEIAFMQGVLDFRDRHALQIGRLYEILANGVGGFLVWWTDTMSRLLLPIPNPRTHPQSGGYQDDWFLTMYHSFVEQSMQEGHRTHVPH